MAEKIESWIVKRNGAKSSHAIDLLRLMYTAPFGVYAVDMTQSIIFWNASAKEILGYSREEVIGKKCYEICNSISVADSEPICLKGCPSIRLARTGRIPSIGHVQMLCASGERKLVTLSPLVIPLGENNGKNILIHVFYDSKEQAQFMLSRNLDNGMQQLLPPRDCDDNDKIAILTMREREVLVLVANGNEPEQIARKLNISKHTVLNHIRNARTKMGAVNKLDAVLTALRYGFI